MEISELPDYAALQQIAKALWKQGKTRGAAVLVGAGFSRNAQLLHTGGNYPPLWSELASEMQLRLDPTVKGWKDPLRLAEEFRVVLGEPALEGLIRDLVTDEEWVPGKLHKRLVELPWVDILTTNWDTLLERAASSVIGQAYETVRSLEDIATTRAPRIVKLHGSLPSNRPFILSEEDYRTYPKLFAPFVNLVQQVFSLLDAGLLRCARVPQDVIDLVLLCPTAVRAGHLLTRNKRPHGMLLLAHKSTRLQLIMYPLIDLAARTVVGRNDECSAGRLGILPRNGRNAFLVSLYLMHTALLVKAFDCGSNLAAR